MIRFGAAAAAADSENTDPNPQKPAESSIRRVDKSETENSGHLIQSFLQQQVKLNQLQQRNVIVIIAIRVCLEAMTVTKFS
ncbi:hypothetical protein LWI28_014481 [Acer negundo]|uniref:Uncharacterized protein n=1 Tax=Acer negundo TaxID=4023 RepID=A0AAD5JD50_ACENE|nr:hypothetical protein LWI28_014481 [Acer negundo]